MINEAPTRPALRYYGGKWALSSWIISFFPRHRHYVEPCGGAASVLLQKDRSALETYNDLDGRIVNFFQVLRDQPDELIRKIRLTPWARAEYEMHREPSADPTEQARRFWVGCTMSIGGMAHTTKGMRINYNSFPGRPPVKVDIEHLEQVARRFWGVQIDNIHYADLIQKTDSPETLFYLDPPYLSSERSIGDYYTVEWQEQDHIDAARILKKCTGHVILSGYASPLYADLYEKDGWQRFDQVAQTNSGQARVESVWLSPNTLKTFNAPRQIGLF